VVLVEFRKSRNQWCSEELEQRPESMKHLRIGELSFKTVHRLLGYRKDEFVVEEHSQYARILYMLDSTASNTYRQE
jgi:hypothetical protein